MSLAQKVSKHYPVFQDFVYLRSTTNNARLATYRAESQQSEKKGVVLFFHGYGSHVGRYSDFVQKLTQAGFDFVGYDYYGFGLSEGERGVVVNKQNHALDAANFVENVIWTYEGLLNQKNLSFHMLGYSFGTQTVLKAYKDHLQYDSELDAKIKSMLLCCGHLGVSQTLMQGQLTAYEKFKTDPTADVLPEGAIAEQADPFVYSKSPQARTFAQMGQMAEEVSLWGHSNLTKPFLMLSAQHDTLIENDNHRRFFENTTKCETKDMVTLDCEHSVLLDPSENDKALPTLVQWLQRF